MRLFIVFQEDDVDCRYTGDAILLRVEHRVTSQTVGGCKEHDKQQSFLYSGLIIVSEKQRWKAGMTSLLKITFFKNLSQVWLKKKRVSQILVRGYALASNLPGKIHSARLMSGAGVRPCRVQLGSQGRRTLHHTQTQRDLKVPLLHLDYNLRG